jgi:hypothetical protein
MLALWLLAILALATSRLHAQQSDDLNQLVGQLQAQFGAAARVEELTKGEVSIVAVHAAR